MLTAIHPVLPTQHSALRTRHQAQGTRQHSDAQSPTAATRLANSGAVSADVTSANTVGYITSTVPKDDSKTFAVTLTACDKPGDPVRVDNLLSSADLFGGGNFDGADQIWRWDTTVQKWAKYFYEKTGRGASVSYAWKKWNYVESKVEALTDADKLAPGEGFIYTHIGDATLTFTWNALEKNRPRAMVRGRFLY